MYDLSKLQADYKDLSTMHSTQLDAMPSQICARCGIQKTDVMDREVNTSYARLCVKCAQFARGIEPQTYAHKPPQEPKDAVQTDVNGEYEKNVQMWKEGYNE